MSYIWALECLLSCSPRLPSWVATLSPVSIMMQPYSELTLVFLLCWPSLSVCILFQGTHCLPAPFIHPSDFKAVLVLLGPICPAPFLNIPCPCSPVLNRWCPFTLALGVLGCVLWCCGLLFWATYNYAGLRSSGRLKLGASRVASYVPLHLLLSHLRASCYKPRLRCLPDRTCC